MNLVVNHQLKSYKYRNFCTSNMGVAYPGTGYIPGFDKPVPCTAKNPALISLDDMVRQCNLRVCYFFFVERVSSLSFGCYECLIDFFFLLQYFSRDLVTLLMERDDINILGKWMRL